MNIIEQLKDYDLKYYNSGTSPISDAEYDALKEMAQLEFPNDPYFKVVGAPVKSKNKVKFNFVMGSLEKFKPDTVQKYLDKVRNKQLRVTPKLDGASIICTFKNGKLISAATRGDGYEGEDITRKVAHMDFGCTPGVDCVLRGEILLSGDLYKTIGMANRRNGVIGIIGRDDDKYVDMLKVLFYELIESNTYDARYPENVIDYHYCVKELIVNNPTSERLEDIYKQFKEDYSDLDLDGIVIEPCDYVRENVDRPKMKIAFKVNEEGTEASVDHIEWNPSRTGRIIPVVLFTEPILLSGAMVSRATAHNAEYAITNKLGPGAIVKVVRSGEVIPYLTEIIRPSDFHQELTACPSCGGKIKRKGVDYLCSNPECSDQQFLKIQHWLVELGAEQVKEATLRALDITSLERLYSLTKADILSFEGFGDSSADTILAEIRKTLTGTPEKLLAAIGIPGIGTRMSEKIFGYIAKTFLPSNGKIAFESLIRMDKSLLRSVDGIGDSVVGKLDQQLLKEVYEKVSSFGFTFISGKDNSNPSGGKMNGLKICMTGAGPLPRKQLEEMISAAGGINGSMAKDTDILVCADPNSGSAKLQKAIKQGTKIISYEDLLGRF